MRVSDLDPKRVIDLTDNWRIRAACRSMAPDLFFPAGTSGVAADEIVAAKEVCFGCEVRSDCLQFAVSTNQEFGVWGGTTEDERRDLRRHWLRRTVRQETSVPPGRAARGGRTPVGATAHPGEATA
jgi:WhiB family redox-sensing transcriptional regulator